MITYSSKNIKAIVAATGCSMQEAKELLQNHEDRITRRDYFAAKAMQAMVGNLPDLAARGTIEQIQEAMRGLHKTAYWHADAMLAESEIVTDKTIWGVDLISHPDSYRIRMNCVAINAHDAVNHLTMYEKALRHANDRIAELESDLDNELAENKRLGLFVAAFDEIAMNNRCLGLIEYGNLLKARGALENICD